MADKMKTDVVLSAENRTEAAFAKLNKQVERLTSTNARLKGRLDAMNAANKQGNAIRTKKIAILKRVGMALHSVNRAAMLYHTTLRQGTRLLKLFLVPLKLVTTGFLLAKAAMTVVGISALKAAGNYQMYRQQLVSVVKSQKDATAAFEESRKFAAETPFRLDELVQARVALEGVGLTGQKALKSVAEGAAALRRSVGDIAAAVKSMESESIKNLGIVLRQDFDKYTLRWTNQMGENIITQATGMRNAQKALLDIFDIKFDGALERMSRTFEGRMSTLLDNIKEVKASFGEGFLPSSSTFIGFLIEGAQEIKGAAKELGESMGKKLEQSMIRMIASFKTSMFIAERIQKLISAEGFGSALNAAFRFGADVLGAGIIAAFKSSISLWEFIGKAIWNAFYTEMLSSDLIPFAGVRRGEMVRSELGKMGTNEFNRMRDALGVPSFANRDDLGSAEKKREQTINFMSEELRKLGKTMEFLRSRGSLDRTRQADQAFRKMSKDLPTILAEMVSGIKTSGLNALSAASGLSQTAIKSNFAKNLSQTTSSFASKRADLSSVLNADKRGGIGPSGTPYEKPTKVEEILQNMRVERESINRLGDTWERSREKATFYRAAVEQATSIANEKMMDYFKKQVELENATTDVHKEEIAKRAEAMSLFWKNSLIEQYNARAKMEYDLTVLSNRWRKVTQTMENSMVNAMERIAEEGSNMADILKSSLREVLVMMRRAMFLEPMAEKAGGFMQGIGTKFLTQMATGALFGGNTIGGITETGGAGKFDSMIANQPIHNAMGGVMTSSGQMPLNRYAGGGIASRPQLAMFGEGSRPEAYVPLPDGKSIPVTMKGGGSGVAEVFINVENTGTPQNLRTRSSFMEQGKLFIQMVAADIQNEGVVSNSIANSKALRR